MYLQLVFATCLCAIICLPAYAGAAIGAPELDSATLSGIAAAFTGCYAAFRLYKFKSK